MKETNEAALEVASQPAVRYSSFPMPADGWALDLPVGWLLLGGGLGGTGEFAGTGLLFPALGSPDWKWCGIAMLGLANQACFLQLFGSPVSTHTARLLELNLCELELVSAKSVKLLWVPAGFNSQAC